MVALHNTVGTLAIVAYLILTILNVLQITGRPIGFLRPVSLIAALLLLVQIVLGIGLISSNHQVPVLHWIIAILALLLVGGEHGWVRTRTSPELRAMAGALIAGATTILLVIAYIIGTGSTN